MVATSTLKPGSASAFGTGDGATVIASGATLDINGQDLTSEPVIVSGSGVGGFGAIINSGRVPRALLHQRSASRD